jgi:hypothetical protein
MTWHFLLPQEQVQLMNVLVAMEAKRTDFDHIRQHVNKVKKYASDLQTFIGVNEMTSVNMSEPCIQTRPLNLVGKLTVVFLVSCGITPSLFSCRICACNSTSLS